MNKSFSRGQFELRTVNKVWSSTLNNEKKMVFGISAHLKKILSLLYVEWSSGPVEKYHSDHLRKDYV